MAGLSENKLIEVCSACKRACCWYGEFMCENNKDASTEIKTVKELRELKAGEHEDYWSDEYMKKVYGNANPFGFKGNDEGMITKKCWKEFRESGLLWWINMILHTFGWAIVFEFNVAGEMIEVYPARVKFRGFDEKSNSEGYKKVSEYINANYLELLDESEDR